MNPETIPSLEDIAVLDRVRDITVEEQDVLDRLNIRTLGDAKQIMDQGPDALPDTLRPHLTAHAELAAKIHRSVRDLTMVLGMLNGEKDELAQYVMAESRDTNLLPIHMQRMLGEVSRKLAIAEEENDSLLASAKELKEIIEAQEKKYQELKAQRDELLIDIASTSIHEIGNDGADGYADLRVEKLPGLSETTIEKLNEAGYRIINEIENDIRVDSKDWWRTRPALTADLAKQVKASIKRLQTAWHPGG